MNSASRPVPPVPPVPLNTQRVETDGRLSAAAAARNREPIAQALAPLLQRPGLRVLELASGTGEHAVSLCRRCPGLIWQPSDIVATHRRSIRAWTLTEGLADQIAEPLALDATALPWPVSSAAAEPWGGVLAINLLHVMPGEGLPAVFAGARQALGSAPCEALADEGADPASTAPGWFAVYGPFRHGDEWFSEGNRSFDQQLRERHPSLGLRDISDLHALARQAGFVHLRVQPMPANNHLLLWR